MIDDIPICFTDLEAKFMFIFRNLVQLQFQVRILLCILIQLLLHLQLKDLKLLLELYLLAHDEFL